MNESKIKKFEHPIRMAELDPVNTLINAGLQENMILCDIGAGTGIFSFAATQISKNDVYALEISDNMIELLEKNKINRNTQKVKVIKVDSTALPLDDGTCDMAIMVTVLHELKDKYNMINEIKRILKVNGKLLIIEFHKKKTPMGPPVDHRISEEQAEEICNSKDFETIDKFSMGGNFYGILFKKLIE